VNSSPTTNLSAELEDSERHVAIKAENRTIFFHFLILYPIVCLNISLPGKNINICFSSFYHLNIDRIVYFLNQPFEF